MADFFEKMKDGFNKGVATVSTGSKMMLEKTKINAVIKNLEDERKQLAEILGNNIHTFCSEHAEGDIPREEVISICNEITARNQQIEVQKKKIEELESEMNQVMGNFAASDAVNVCRCGHENAAGAKFCAKCGSKLN